MPARKTKPYLGVSGPGASTDAIVPQNPRRIGLVVQNTGANPGLLRFGGPTQGNGSDLAFAAGAREKWDRPDTVPLEAVSVSSTAATTWAIYETVQE